jgi:magnesium transporter
MDTFASLINNNLNNVMKYLAAATILLAAPTWIASLWGMNVELPMKEDPHAFAILMASSAVLALSIVGVFFYLYKKRIF